MQAKILHGGTGRVAILKDGGYLWTSSDFCHGSCVRQRMGIAIASVDGLRKHGHVCVI